MIAVVVSLCVPLGLLLLALMPALAELHHPSDVAPLNVPHDHDNHATRFAASYRERLQAMFGAPLAQTLQLPAAADVARVGAMQLWSPGAPAKTPSPDAPLACAGDLRLPEGWHSAHEVYAAVDLSLGAGGSARALLADGVLRLGTGSRVVRWVHGRDVYFDSDSSVGARVSAEQRIELAEGATFVRANAPTIAWPAVAVMAMQSAPETAAREFDGAPGARYDAANGRWIVFRALTLPAATRVRGDMIIHGNAHLHENCRIDGSLKVHGQLQIDAGCVITGACVGVRRIEVKAWCCIAGPLIGEGELRIGPHAVIGELAKPTSVNSRSIELRRGACVHGTAWAKQTVRAII